MVWKWVKRIFWTLALTTLALILAGVLVVRFGSTSYPLVVDYRGEAPAPLLEEVESIVRHAASKRDFHVDVIVDGISPWDGLPAMALWLLPNERRGAPILMSVSRQHDMLTMHSSEWGIEEAAWTMAEQDAAVAEVRGRLEDELGLALCDFDTARSVCPRPAEPRLLYRMDFDGRGAEAPEMPLYELADRHRVRVFVDSREPSTEDGVEGALAAHFYPDRRAVLRGEHPLVLATGEGAASLLLSAFDRGGVSADRVDALAADAKAMLESHYGRPFCRADPATGRCDEAHAEMEREREAWLRVRRGDPAAIEAFLAARPESPHAGEARERAARLRRMAEPPPPAAPAPSAPWVGRRAGETFADRLPDGAAGPLLAVVPAGVFRMGCAAGAGCAMEELPAREVRVARPFALSARETTHAEFYRFARPAKRLDPSWSERPATHLTWEEAAAYAAWLSEKTGAAYRLPSEAEWEYAARAGAATAYPWGDRMEPGRARCHECPGPHPTGVDPFGRPQDLLWVLAAGSYPANAWGFHDMHGNAAEWTADCWHPDHLDAPPDGAARTDGDCSRRVARGGSYDTPAHALRSSARVGKIAGERYLDTGFRVLRELRNVEARDE